MHRKSQCPRVDCKYSLRRRFEQNQEDCTFTVLAILPTATENILEAIPVEQVLEQLQQQKAERLARSVGPSEIASSAPPSVADDDGKSLTSFQSESYVHASQVADTEASSSSRAGAAEGGEATEQKPKKTKAQLWNEMKISCTCFLHPQFGLADTSSYIESLYINIHAIPTHTPYEDTAQPARPTELPRQRRIAGCPILLGHEDQSRKQRR
jgi:hypothetical protein